ncbi:DNA-processing protein DprA [Conexibacter sp. SYSU D00693]|uniref:DNA-processing protein DprA n=1 Tax=Conexibacter sp. SYSU D00693 TaxID=2812560 RepID=UPI00196A506E|nr:DNA-processing protein DprA [Conexibacter sp. SYSU D00693]
MSAAPTACERCLRRSARLAQLSGHLEIAHKGRRPVRDVLALDEEALVLALAGRALSTMPSFDVAAARTRIAAAGLAATCVHDDHFPSRLRDDRSGPLALHVLAAGAPQADALHRLAGLVGGAGEDRPPSVAIVGTRRASQDGVEVARALGRGLAAAGVTVVSGMAMGIDSAAHDGALEGGGRTVAVLAGGADVPYPRTKVALHGRIARAGVVVAELPPGTGVRRWAFPARNRIIAALADVVVVVEAAERSGSLITAEMAIDLGRDVAAVPGSPRSWRSGGTNALLRDGATLVRDARDVLDVVVGVEEAARATRPGGPAPVPAGLAPGLAELLSALDDGRDTIDALAATPDDAGAVADGLGELELLGLVRRGAAGRYRRVPV